jgi:energy-coupling factor transporter ATP-binding protein EcfA2
VKRLLFLGHTGTGKSSMINALTGSLLLTSDSTDFCTSQIAVASCKLGEHYIDCIDTPGFGGRIFSDAHVLRMVQNRLKKDHRQGQRIHAVFYLINISTPRKNTALATDIDVFLKLVGDGLEADDVWKNVCFVYTHGIDPNATGRGIAQILSSQATRLEDFAKDLGPKLKKGARTCHLIEDTDEEAESYIQQGSSFS